MRPFMLLTYAIVALVITGLVVTLMMQYFPKENVFEKLRDGLDYSETTSNLGIAHYTGKLQIDKDLTITKTALNKDNISLAVECNDPEVCCPNSEKCSKPIEWDYEKIRFKRDETIATYTRCEIYLDELICRIYFGQMPAQAKIINIDYIDNGGTINSIVKVTNTGESELTIGQNSLRVLKKIGDEWIDTYNIYPAQEINLLTPKQEHSFVWETELMSGGEYKLEFTFEGTNAGHDTNSFELVVGENQNCQTIENVQEVQDLNETHIRIIRYCEGCKFGYECLAKWMERNDGENYEPYKTNSVYYVTNMPVDELCDCVEKSNPTIVEALKDYIYEGSGWEAVPAPTGYPYETYYTGNKCNEWTNVNGTIE